VTICGGNPAVRRATEDDQNVQDGIYELGQLLWVCKKCGEVWRIHAGNMNDAEVVEFLRKEVGLN